MFGFAQRLSRSQRMGMRSRSANHFFVKGPESDGLTAIFDRNRSEAALPSRPLGVSRCGYHENCMRADDSGLFYCAGPY
jgi:hypothetical protein